MIEGVDYAFLPEHPSIPGLASAGIQFACRYLGPGTSDKHLTPSEADELAAHGIAIVANAEGAATGLLGGYKTGFDWAAQAADQAHDCGMPPGRPIYLSADWDVISGQWPYVRQALQGAAEALGGPHRVGIYGSAKVMEWARNDGVAQWFWQTYAWSGGRWAAGNNIEQYRNGVSLAGGTVDLNRALTIDYGQWRGTAMTDEDLQELLNHARTASMVNWATTNRTWAILENHEACYYTIGSEELKYLNPRDGQMYSRMEPNGIHAALKEIKELISEADAPTLELLTAALKKVLLDGVDPRQIV